MLQLKYIIYHSTASIYFREEKLEEMMLKFRKNNIKNNITGLLLYSEGVFLQLIEGEDALINKVMKKIQKDKIHHSIIVLVDTKSELRMFPDWSMGFKTMQVQEFEKIRQLIPNSLQPVNRLDYIENHPMITYFKGFVADPAIKVQNA